MEINEIGVNRLLSGNMMTKKNANKEFDHNKRSQFGAFINRSISKIKYTICIKCFV